MTNVRVYTRPETEPQAQDYPNVAANFLLQQAEDEARELKWHGSRIELGAGRIVTVEYNGPDAYRFYLWDCGRGFKAAHGSPWLPLDREAAIKLLAACIEGGAS